MGLITCPDCEKQISELAPAGPSCDRPIQPPPSQKPAESVQTIQATEKKLKALQLIGALLTLISVIIAMSGSSIGRGARRCGGDFGATHYFWIGYFFRHPLRCLVATQIIIWARKEIRDIHGIIS